MILRDMVAQSRRTLYLHQSIIFHGAVRRCGKPVMGGVQYQASFVNQQASFHLVAKYSLLLIIYSSLHVSVRLDCFQPNFDPPQLLARAVRVDAKGRPEI